MDKLRHREMLKLSVAVYGIKPI